jgi:hypothetical protein
LEVRRFVEHQLGDGTIPLLCKSPKIAAADLWLLGQQIAFRCTAAWRVSRIVWILPFLGPIRKILVILLLFHELSLCNVLRALDTNVERGGPASARIAHAL